MRGIKWLGLAAALVTVGSLAGQVPQDKGSTRGKTVDADAKAPPSKDSLEQLLTDALRHSPDIQLADAKVREAEAELRKTRLQIMQRVIELQSAVEAQKQKVSAAEEAFQRLTKLFAAAAVPGSELAKARADFETAKGALKQAELPLGGLTGRFPAQMSGVMGGMGLGAAGMPGALGGGAIGMLGGLGGGTPLAGGTMVFPGGVLGIGGGLGGVPDAAANVKTPRGPMAEKIRKALDSPVKVSGLVNKPLMDVLVLVRDLAPGVQVLVGTVPPDTKVTLTLSGEIALGALIQAIQDVVPIQFYARDYGIYVTSEGAPEGGLLLHDFWREPQKGR